MVATSGSLSCSGTIRATFTWQPDGADDVPPPAVVVAETCRASWESTYDVSTPATGSSNNDLGFPEATAMSGYSNTRPASGSSNGTCYKVQTNPQETFTITCSPSVEVSGTGGVGPPIKGGNATGSLSYKAKAQLLDVVLSGGIGIRKTSST